MRLHHHMRTPTQRTVAAGAGGGTASPAGPPGSLIALCVASVCGQSVRLEETLAFWFFGTRGAPKRDAVSALDSQVEERTSLQTSDARPQLLEHGLTENSIRISAYAKVLARIKNCRRVAIWMAKWRYGGRGAPGERSESQSKLGVRGQRPRAILFLASMKNPIYITANLMVKIPHFHHVASHACHFLRGANA
jgi:hypothetical protein